MKKLEFTIREATSKDIAGILSVASSSSKYTYTGIFSDEYLEFREKCHSCPDYIKKTEVFLDNGIGIKLVAVDSSGKILGFKFDMPDENGEWNSWSFYLDPTYIGIGIGRALFLEFVKILRSMNVERFYVDCMTENKSIEWYKKMGGIIIKQWDEEKRENKSVSQLEFYVNDIII